MNDEHPWREYAPPPGHHCNIGWEAVPWPRDAFPPPLPGITTRYEEAHRWDAPGTVRQCGTCGRHWVAEKYPNEGRMITLGVRWRPEKRRERRRRQRRAARMSPST